MQVTAFLRYLRPINGLPDTFLRDREDKHVTLFGICRCSMTVLFFSTVTAIGHDGFALL